MANIEIGDLFQIDLITRNAFLHYVHNDERIGQLVKVFAEIEFDEKFDFEKLANMNENFMVYFPLKAAVRKKIVEKVGSLALPDNFRKPEFMRTKHIVRGELQGWHIVNTDTWQNQFVKKLSDDQKALSPWGVWNDTLLIERLKKSWSLETWK